MNSGAILDRLKRLHPRLIDLSLDRIERLLAALGEPQRALPPVIHVAGTNGKGSTVALLRAVLEAAGAAVHVYTSPHLVRFHERIVIAGRMISEDALAARLAECEAANGGAAITFFEITTAAAFLAFARAPADVLLLETGLGGRLDATNVVARPAVTVITPISLDHQAYLGATLCQIAGEKAGILKAGVPCVVASQEPEAAAVIRGRAAALGAPLSEQGRHWQVATRDGGMIYADAAGMLSLPLPCLPGVHQVGNAGAAIAAVRAFSPVRCAAAAIAAGMRSAVWPARLQRLDTGRLAALLPQGWELWLDGGHNPAAAAALAQHLAGWRDRPAGLVLGLLSSKDAAGFIAPLKPYASAAATVAIPGEPAAVAAADLAAVAASVGLRATPAVSVAEALVSLRDQIRRPARVLICGSLYLAGHVLAENSAA